MKKEDPTLNLVNVRGEMRELDIRPEEKIVSDILEQCSDWKEFIAMSSEEILQEALKDPISNSKEFFLSYGSKFVKVVAKFGYRFKEGGGIAVNDIRASAAIKSGVNESGLNDINRYSFEMIKTGENHFKKASETALISKSIYVMLKEISNKLNLPVNFELFSIKEKMIEWTKSEEGGAGIFKWDNAEFDKQKDGWIFQKTIHPEEKN
jgi:hypothetical protein